MIKLTECPRDAMQGLHDFVPTELKIKYLQKLLAVQFDVLDFGSFVSPKAIPQMRDTEQIINSLDLSDSKTQLLAIVANLRGARNATEYRAIHYIGYPFSISKTFQMRNTNASLEDSYRQLAEIQSVCSQNNKSLVVYLSMAFGNPYGDEWNADIALRWMEQLNELSIQHVALSDTIGVAHPESIQYLFGQLIPAYPNIHFSAHFHTRPEAWEPKIKAAYEAGCRSFDGAIKGYGGCPMAKDELTGNMPTEKVINYFLQKNESLSISLTAFMEAMEYSNNIFNFYH